VVVIVVVEGIVVVPGVVEVTVVVAPEVAEAEAEDDNYRHFILRISQ
jgi:hypothetical protein